MSAQEQKAYVTRAERARHGNDRIARKAEQFRFHAPVPLLCECGDPACEEFVPLLLEEFRHARAADRDVLAPGH